jgi:hypothetical protein
VADKDSAEQPHLLQQTLSGQFTGAPQPSALKSTPHVEFGQAAGSKTAEVKSDGGTDEACRIALRVCQTAQGLPSPDPNRWDLRCCQEGDPGARGKAAPCKSAQKVALRSLFLIGSWAGTRIAIHALGSITIGHPARCFC